MNDPYLTPKRSPLGLILKILGGLALLAILLVVGAVFALESLINSRKDAELAKVSQQLGRPLKMGKISLSLRAGRIAIEDVSLGRDPAIPEEPDPALSIGLVRLEVPIWPIVTSKGKAVRVKDVTVERFSAAVVRLSDDKLNWQKLAERFESKEKEPDKPLDEESRAIARDAVIEKVRLEDLGVKLIDLGNQGATGPATVEIRDFDLALDNVSMKSPIDVKISAAILQASKNFDLAARLGAAPDVPGQLPPPPLESVKLKLAPTALAPLAPFLAAVQGADVLKEVLAGTVESDVDVAAGAAVPGGTGPTHVKGFVALAGLKFAGGEAFDARVDSDVDAAVPEGAATIKKLVVRLADMGVDVEGKLTGLGPDGEPQVDGFKVVSRALDFSRLHGFYPAMDKAAGATLRGPFSLDARGSASEGDQRVVARIDLTSASIDVPGQFKKLAGTPLVFETTASAKRNLIEVKRAALTFAKLTMQATATLRTQGAGKNAKRSFEATADVPPVAVRDLVALVAPKELPNVPAVTFGGRAEAAGTIGQDETLKVKVPSFTLTGGKSDLAGSLALADLTAPKVDFEGHSKYLDVDDFLPPSAKDKKGKATEPSEPPPLLKATTGTVKLTVDKGRAADIDYQRLKADLGLKGGRLAAKALEVDTFGGHFSGAGTELPITDPKTGFHARGDVSNVDLPSLLAHFAPERNVMTGKLFAKVDLSGASTLPDIVRQTLDGRLGGRVENAQLTNVALLDPIVEALEKASTVPLFTSAIRGAKDKVAALKDKRLGKLGGALAFHDGAAKLTKPLEAATPSGPLTITGGMTLTGEADMNAELSLKPEIASALTGNKARFDAPVPVTLRIEGPLQNPRIRPSDPVALAKVFATALAKGEAGRFVADKAKVVLENPAVVKAREDAERARAQATTQAEQARAQAAAEADRVRREAEERAAKAREDAEQKAKDAAKNKLKGIFGR